MAAIQNARRAPGGSCQSYSLAAAEPPRLGGKASGETAVDGPAPAKTQKQNEIGLPRQAALGGRAVEAIPGPQTWLPVGPESLRLEMRRFKRPSRVTSSLAQMVQNCPRSFPRLSADRLQDERRATSWDDGAEIQPDQISRRPLTVRS